MGEAKSVVLAARCSANKIVVRQAEQAVKALSEGRPTIIKKGAIDPLSDAIAGKTISKFVATEVIQLLEVSGRESAVLLEALRNASDMSTFNHDDPRGGRTAELISRLAEGDALRGEAIYTMAQLACIDCHAIAGKGVARLGPRVGEVNNDQRRACAEPDPPLESAIFIDLRIQRKQRV